MELNDNETPCPTCGHHFTKGDGWQPTNNLRIVPVEGFDILGTTLMSVGGLFPRMSEGTIKAVVTPRYRTERQWIRTWGEAEWRFDS